MRLIKGVLAMISGILICVFWVMTFITVFTEFPRAFGIVGVWTPTILATVLLLRIFWGDEFVGWFFSGMAICGGLAFVLAVYSPQVKSLGKIIDKSIGSVGVVMFMMALCVLVSGDEEEG